MVHLTTREYWLNYLLDLYIREMGRKQHFWINDPKTDRVFPVIDNGVFLDGREATLKAHGVILKDLRYRFRKAVSVRTRAKVPNRKLLQLRRAAVGTALIKTYLK